MNIAATELTSDKDLLSIVNKEDIVITKSNKPCAVIVDINRYNELINQAKEQSINKKLDAINSLKAFNLGGKNYSEIKSEIS
jgi:prevent-host-death family protein